MNINTQDCTCFRIRKASRRITQIYDLYLKKASLNSTQFSILSAVSNMGPQSITDLAKLTGTDRTTLTRSLKRISDQDLLEILPGHDERSRIVQITRSGKARLKHALPHWKTAQITIVSVMGKSNWKTLISSIEKLESTMQKLR